MPLEECIKKAAPNGMSENERDKCHRFEWKLFSNAVENSFSSTKEKSKKDAAKRRKYRKDTHNSDTSQREGNRTDHEHEDDAGRELDIFGSAAQTIRTAVMNVATEGPMNAKDFFMNVFGFIIYTKEIWNVSMTEATSVGSHLPEELAGKPFCIPLDSLKEKEKKIYEYVESLSNFIKPTSVFVQENPQTWWSHLDDPPN